MLLPLIIHALLMLAAMLYIVPAVTDTGVAIRRTSAVRGVLGLIVIVLVNNIFWHVFALAGTSTALGAKLVEIGVVGWLLNSLAIFLTGRVMPGVLYVRSFASAMGASLVLIVVGWLTSLFLL